MFIGGSASTLVGRARSFMLSVLTSTLTGNRASAIISQQHKGLRMTAIARKTALKHRRFLHLRELPRIDLLSKSVNNPIALRQSILKKY